MSYEQVKLGEQGLGEQGGLGGQAEVSPSIHGRPPQRGYNRTWKIVGVCCGMVVLLFVLRWLVECIMAHMLGKLASNVMGVPTEVDYVDIGIVEAQARGFRVSNPERFQDIHPYFCVVQLAVADLRWTMLFSEKVEIDEFQLSGLRVNIETHLFRSNIDIIQRNIEEFERALGLTAKKGTRLKFIIGLLEISDIQVTIHATGMPEAVVPVPDVTLHDVGRENDGVTSAQLIAQLVTEIFRAATKVDETAPTK